MFGGCFKGVLRVFLGCEAAWHARQPLLTLFPSGGTLPWQGLAANRGGLGRGGKGSWGTSPGLFSASPERWDVMDEEWGGSGSAQGLKRLFQVTPAPTRPRAMGPGGFTGMGGAGRIQPAGQALLLQPESPKVFPRVLPGLGGLRRCWELSAGILAAGVL